MSEKILIDVNAIKISQRPLQLENTKEFIREYDFFIFKLSSKTLLKAAKFLGRRESKLGVQRSHKEDRDREIGRFITSDHPFFPNTIIVNFPMELNSEMFNETNNHLYVEVSPNSTYIIDGQHRLKAFESKYSDGREMDLVVAAYFGLELPTIAEIFTRINFYQTPVSKSLVYDLLDINQDPNFMQYRDAHDIASYLNDKIGSVFYSNIKMLGIGKGYISQASFVEAFSTKFKIVSYLKNNKLYSNIQIANIIDEYYSTINNAFRENVYGEYFVLSSSVIFNAFAYLLYECTLIDYKDFKNVALKIIDGGMNIDGINVYGGFNGVTQLGKKFVELVLGGRRNA